MFTEKDIIQIKNQGLTTKDIENQIKNFFSGFPFLDIEKPATIGDGIIQLNDNDLKAYQKLYDDSKPDVLKFVPASGAASRMFKFLFEFYAQAEEKYDHIDEIEDEDVKKFFQQIEQFAFYNELKSTIQSAGYDIKELIKKGNLKTILKYFLTGEGLNYGSKPKAVLLFHQSEQQVKTAFEEHLAEGARYARNADGKVKIHFTISPEHAGLFSELSDQIKSDYEKKLNVKFEITYSQQKPSTDMIAVDMENNLFRNDDDSLLFRPGGHGALIENLNDLETEIIFIKNIDNVVPDRLKDETVKYKKALAGILLSFKEKIFKYIDIIKSAVVSDDDISEIKDFIKNDLSYSFDLNEVTDQKKFLFDILNRPIRVCGMVKNEGEPGGGPFWVKHSNHSDLQIVETSQINQEDNKQLQILKKSTHFNPVDLVCSIKDYKGEKFDLLKFRDSKTGFISKKSKDGRDLKAQELPGLWNGAMANWNTIFVEVPIITFNPVKTVNDLLRTEHQ